MVKNFLINGKDTPGLNPFDRGLAYGDGIFRTFLVKNSEPIHWKLHYLRLCFDLNIVNITPPKESLLLKDIKALFPTKGIFVGKIIITRGISERGYQYPKIEKHNRILLKSQYKEINPELYINGVTLGVCSTRINNVYKYNGIKHLNRLDNVLAKNELDNTVFDGIMLDQAGFVNECVSSSIYARYNDILITSNHTNGGIFGITKEIIITKIKKVGLKINHDNITLQDLKKADEVVITNSLFGALQVTKLNETAWKMNNLSSVIRELINEEV